MSITDRDSTVGDPAAVRPPEPRASRHNWSPWSTVVVLCAAAGIALLSVSFALARANNDLDMARLLFWSALTVIVGPALARLLAHSTDRSERILLVALTALSLYWTKVLLDPVQLLFPDEFIHFTNTQLLAQSGHLYGKNSLLPVSADYPALAIVTVALSKLSGLGLFPCALVVIGVAKVVLSLALFLVFERLSGSARIAGVGALLYSAHANYLFWSSQFSYESLSVPLLAVALVCLVSRNGAVGAQRTGWSAFGCLIAVTVAVTHHVTAYALMALLWAQVAVSWRSGRTDVRPPLAMAAAATVATLAWVTFAAGGTGSYLGGIFGRLIDVVSAATSNTGATRGPFQGGASGSAVGTTPLDDQLVAAASVLLVAVGVFAGVLAARRRSWADPLVLVLGLAAVGAVAAYPLRAFPDAWEISNRTADFLFIGVALMAAVAAVAFVDRGRWRWRAPAIAGAGVVAIAGGGVLGWPGNARLPRPIEAQVEGASIKAPAPQMVEWARMWLPANSAFLANDTDGRLLSVAGFRRVWAGSSATGARELLTFDVIPQWQWDILRKNAIDYVVVDRRAVSTDNVIGYSYPRPTEARRSPVLGWASVRRKYEELSGSGRIFDNGDIVVYDIRRPRERSVSPADG